MTTNRKNKYFKENYTSVFSSKEGVVLGDSTINYELMQRNSNRKEFIVWMDRVVDLSDLGLDSMHQQIKSVVFSETEHGALNQSFKKYFKGQWQGFRFGKDLKMVA